jgi:hypothetical protein
MAASSVMALRLLLRPSVALEACNEVGREWLQGENGHPGLFMLNAELTFPKWSREDILCHAVTRWASKKGNCSEMPDKCSRWSRAFFSHHHKKDTIGQFLKWNESENKKVIPWKYRARSSPQNDGVQTAVAIQAHPFRDAGLCVAIQEGSESEGAIWI